MLSSHSHTVDKNASAEMRTALILSAVANCQYDSLATYARPVERGGFGWSLDVRSSDGKTPISVAVEMKLVEMVLRLILPLNEKGFGLFFDEESLRKFEEDKYHCTAEAKKSSYERHELSRVSSCINMNAVIDADSTSEEKYYPVSEFSSVSHSMVRLFAKKNDDRKHYVVKSSRKPMRGESQSWLMLCSAEEKSREASFINLLYPELGPALAAHFVDHQRYDSRIILRYVDGEHPDTLAATLASTVECAHMLLAIALELQRIHNHRVVHRDVKAVSIIASKAQDHVQSEKDFVVHFIDMECAAYAGSIVTPYIKNNVEVDYLAPETMISGSSFAADYSQDVFGLAYMMKKMTQQSQMTLPSIASFIDSGLGIDPATRPKLDDFITELSREIEEAAQTHAKRRAPSSGC